MVGSQATAPQAHAVQPPHPARMAFHQAIGGNIPVDAGHPAHHRHPTDVNELVNAQTATHHRTVFDHHVARHLNGIGHHDVVAEIAVVAQMAIGHQQVAVADAGHLALFGGAVDRHAFPQRVSITDQHLGVGTAVLEILRRKPEAGAWVHLVVTAQGQPTIQHGMGTDPGVLSDHHLRADHRTRADDHTGGQLGLRVHHRRGVDLL